MSPRLIGRAEMFDPLLVACPTFRPAWEKFLAEWSDESDDPPDYLALGDLCRHVIDLMRQGERDAVRRVLAVVEAWHTNGDAYVREAATIGFLETLDNLLSHETDGRAVQARVRSLAGPQTEHWWAKLDQFWAGDAGALSGRQGGDATRTRSRVPIDRRIVERFGVPHVLSANMVFVAAPDAEAFLAGCESLGARLLGIEGFRIVDGATVPDMGLILDLTIGGTIPSAEEGLRAARRFLREHVPADVLLEFSVREE